MRLQFLGLAAGTAGIIWIGEQFLVQSLAIFGSGNWPLGIFALFLIGTGCAAYLRLAFSLSLARATSFALIALLAGIPIALVGILPLLDWILQRASSLASSGELANGFIFATLAVASNLAPQVRSGAAWLKAAVALAAAVALCIGLEILFDWFAAFAPTWTVQPSLRSLLYAVAAWCLVSLIMQSTAMSSSPSTQ